MNSFPVVALAAVADDIQVAHDYFELQLAGAGDRFLKRYFQTTDRIGLNAWSFPVRFDDYHRALIPKSNFAIYYFRETDRSVIAAVISARRDPRLIRDFVRLRRQS